MRGGCRQTGDLFHIPSIGDARAAARYDPRVDMKAPATLETSRLLLRTPADADADDVFARYASDEDVTRYVGWPRHRSVDDTRGFLAFSRAEWERNPAGPYLIHARADGRLLGGTGLSFETGDCAMTGYVLARDAWGQGYATEALQAMLRLAPTLGVRCLFALCHADHRPSWRVLEKCGLVREAPARVEFPNLAPGQSLDAFRYAIAL
jgi:[ribosomal protein S5]-alanine N-acetyltransferase